jgi:hypothetical protein
MPADLCIFEPGSGGNAMLVRKALFFLAAAFTRAKKNFRRPLEETDWPRFEYYSRKIHSLGDSPFLNVRRPASEFKVKQKFIETQVYIALASYRPARMLLPNLGRIDFGTLPPATYPFLQPFLGPKLVNISIKTQAIEFEGLATSLSRLSPNIHTVRIGRDIVKSPVLPQLVSSMHHLRNLHIENSKEFLISSQLATHLSNLPDLTKLVGIRIPIYSVHTFTTAGGNFPSLQELVFSIIDWTSAAEVLELMSCAFTTLTVYCTQDNPTTLSSFRRFTEVMERHRSCSSLTHLCLIAPKDTSSGTDPVDSAHEVFKPLCRFVALTHVTLSLEITSQLADPWLSDMVESWPALEYLEIIPKRKVTQMTLRGLIPLVKQCPRLKMLGIPMHVRPVDPALLDGVYNSRLTDFFSLHSTIHSPTQVFRSLIRMFPNLKWVGYGSDPEYGKSWEEVRRLLDDSAFTGT